MKTFDKSLIIAAMLVPVTLAGPVLAKDHGARMFERLDTNTDGYIDRAEVDAAQAERFAKADTNGDGALSAEEMHAARAEHREGRKGKRRGGHGRADFDTLDADKDGSITRAEWDAAKSARMDRRQARMMDRLDTNKDGLIQQSELGGGFADRLFERLDADEDGRISKAEAEKMRGKFRKNRKSE